MIASRASTLRAGHACAVARPAYRFAAPVGRGSASRRADATRSFAGFKIFGIEFGKPAAEEMGNSGSSTAGGAASSGWSPSPATTGSADPSAALRRVSRSGHDVTPLTKEQRDAEAAKLNDFQRYVTLEQGTERAFTGVTANGYSWEHKGRGTYVSAIGGLPLFSSDTKFNSGTGWPSFYAPIDPEHIIEVTDMSIPFMPRVEVIDARGGAHLGHVFDEPRRPGCPTGKRYCINAAALRFIPEGEPLPGSGGPADSETASKN